MTNWAPPLGIKLPRRTRRPRTEVDYLYEWAFWVGFWQRELRMHDWTLYASFKEPDEQEDGPYIGEHDFNGHTASVTKREQYGTGVVCVSPYADPRHYAYLACHEVLHLRLWEAEQVPFEDYKGASRTIIGGKIHTAIDRMAEVLTGFVQPNDGSLKLPQPAWRPVVHTTDHAIGFTLKTGRVRVEILPAE